MSKNSYLRRNGDAPYQFLMRVPLKLLPRVKGRSLPISLPPSGEEAPVLVSTKIGDFVKFSLRTRDQGVAKAREAVARSELHKLFNAVGRGPTTILALRAFADQKGFDGPQVALDGGVHPIDELFAAKTRGCDALLLETAGISIRHELSLVHDYEHRSPP